METGWAILAGSGAVSVILALIWAQLKKQMYPLARQLAKLIRDQRAQALVLTLIKEAEKQWPMSGTGAQKMQFVLKQAEVAGEPVDRALVEEILAAVKAA
jgi:hypothetical protein